MKENRKNDSKNENIDSKIKNNLKIEGNLQKIKAPTLLSEKDLKMKERDVILKTKYSATLKSSAELFLVDLFEKISTINNYENVNLEVPISAAMAIITNTSWHQPTEAQIEYDFTRECIDKGIYEFGQIDEFDDEQDEEEIGDDTLEYVVDSIIEGIDDDVIVVNTEDIIEDISEDKERDSSEEDSEKNTDE